MSKIPFRTERRAMRAMSVFVTSLMVALAMLALAGAATLRHVDMEWRQALTDRWTVELDTADPTHPAGPDNADGAVTALRALPGIADARTVPPDEIRRLLQPWLHDNALTAQLPLPVLIDVRVDGTQPQATVARQIAAALPTSKLDDHSAWTRDLLRLAQAGEAFGLVIFAAIALTATFTIIATARARLAINLQEIELLHTIGASDGYIAGQFQAGAFRSTLAGALIGAAIAAAAVFVAIATGPSVIPFVSQLTLAPIDWAVLAMVPIGAVLLATLATRWAALGLARQLP